MAMSMERRANLWSLGEKIRTAAPMEATDDAELANAVPELLVEIDRRRAEADKLLAAAEADDRPPFARRIAASPLDLKTLDETRGVARKLATGAATEDEVGYLAAEAPDLLEELERLEGIIYGRFGWTEEDFEKGGVRIE
jgi:hypothetical protein